MGERCVTPPLVLEFVDDGFIKEEAEDVWDEGMLDAIEELHQMYRNGGKVKRRRRNQKCKRCRGDDAWVGGKWDRKVMLLRKR